MREAIGDDTSLKPQVTPLQEQPKPAAIADLGCSVFRALILRPVLKTVVLDPDFGKGRDLPTSPCYHLKHPV